MRFVNILKIKNTVSILVLSIMIFSCAKHENKTNSIDIPFEEVLAGPEKYEGTTVTIRGYFLYRDENTIAIYKDAESAKNKTLKKAIYIFSVASDELTDDYMRTINNKYVVITGDIFLYQGPYELYSCSLDLITIIDPIESTAIQE